jgi:hypothetical protein
MLAQLSNWWRFETRHFRRSYIHDYVSDAGWVKRWEHHLRDARAVALSQVFWFLVQIKAIDKWQGHPLAALHVAFGLYFAVMAYHYFTKQIPDCKQRLANAKARMRRWPVHYN